MESNIVQELKNTGNIRNLWLAESIRKRQESMTISYREALIDIKNEEKAYKLFVKLLSNDSKEELTMLDIVIDHVKGMIYDESGWWMTGRDGFRYEDNHINMRDPEFRTWDTYRIYRGEDGFYVPTDEPFNPYFAKIREKEQRFFDRYEEDLELLHSVLTTKENFMSGDYELKDEKNRVLASEISKFLGYKIEGKGKKKIKD